MKKQNPTTQIVRAAMKAVSKDVRAPKVVRDKIVKPAKKKKPTPSISAYPVPRKPIVVLGAKLNDINFKKEQIESVSTISWSLKTDVVWDEIAPGEYRYEKIISRKEFGDVTLHVKMKPAKLKKIKKLFDEFVYGTTANYMTMNIDIEADENSFMRYSLTGYLKQIELPFAENEYVVYALTFSVNNMICSQIWN